MSNKTPKEEIDTIIASELFKIEEAEEPKFKRSLKGDTEGRLKMLEYIVTGAIIVLVVGFVTMFGVVAMLIWNTTLWTADVYREFIQELDEHNNNFEILEKELKTYNKLKTNSEIIKPKIPKVE